MVLHKEAITVDPKSTPLGLGILQEWQSIERGAVLDVQKYQLGEAGKAMSQLKNLALSRSASGSPAPFRVVTTCPPYKELASGKTAEEALADADLLRRFLAGATPASPDLIPPALVSALAQAAEEAAKQGSANQAAAAEGARGNLQDATTGSAEAPRLESVAQWGAPDVLKELEPWAVALVDNADKLRYACYAFKIASALAADGSTSGLGGDEVVKLCFAAIDAAIASSWFQWFTKSLLDDSRGSNIVRQVISLDFEGGPRRIVEQVSQFTVGMRREDVEHVTRLANALKRRVAVMTGDLIALFLPNDANLSNVIVTEMIMQLNPADATAVLLKLIGYYEMLPTGHRTCLERQESLRELVTASNGKVKGAVMSEYDLPLHRKAENAIRRQATVSMVSVVCPPLRIVTPALVAMNAVGTAGIGAGVGKQACNDVFAALDGKTPTISATIHRSLAVAFGTLVLLAHCADRSGVESTNGGVTGGALRVMEAVGRLAPAVATSVNRKP